MTLISKFTGLVYNIIKEDDTYYYYQGVDDIRRKIRIDRVELFFKLGE
jgi:hypothetical protein